MSSKKFLMLLSVVCMLFLPLASYGLDSDTDIYESPPTLSPYYAGVVKREVLEKTLEELNYVRRITGLPDNVELDDRYTELAQHGALLLDAVKTLTHTPKKPSDMSDEFYELGYAGTSSSNIASSNIASGATLLGSIVLYMDDSDSRNIASVGHRRWLINPGMYKVGFGISGGFSATRVFQELPLKHYVENILKESGDVDNFGGFSYIFKNEEESDRFDEWQKNYLWPISDDFVSWPTRKVPHPLYFFGSSIAWSVTLNTDVFVRFKNMSSGDISVKLTCLDDGRVWNFSKSQSDGYFNIDASGYGEGQCIIFRPSSVGSYDSGSKWRAEISGLVRISDDVSGEVLSFDVTFTDELTGYESDSYLERLRNKNTDSGDTGNGTGQNKNSNGNNSNNNEGNTNGQQGTQGNDSPSADGNTNSKQESSGGGGCNTFCAVLAALTLGIPCLRKNLSH